MSRLKQKLKEARLIVTGLKGYYCHAIATNNTHLQLKSKFKNTTIRNTYTYRQVIGNY